MKLKNSHPDNDKKSYLDIKGLAINPTDLYFSEHDDCMLLVENAPQIHIWDRWLVFSDADAEEVVKKNLNNSNPKAQGFNVYGKKRKFLKHIKKIKRMVREGWTICSI